MSQNQPSNSKQYQPRKWRTLVRIESVGDGTMQVDVPAFDPVGGYIIPKPEGLVFETGQRWFAWGYTHEGLETFDFERWEPAPEVIPGEDII